MSKITFTEWITQMEEAQSEIRRVRELNLPTIKENRPLEEENKRFREENKHLKKKKELHVLKPLPFKIADWAQERVKRESSVRKTLKKVTPKQWLERIKAVNEIARNRVACRVWWDHFGGRKVKNRWPHLDSYVNAPMTEVSDDEVIAGLYSVGYSPWEAKKRATTEISESEESQEENEL